jgi:MFS transporter, DHA1 family, tetracycline resistance protein
MSARVAPVAAVPRQAAMPFIMFAVLIDMLSVGLIVPVLPAMVGQFTHDPAEQTYWYGAIVFTFSLASFVATPLLGALSDRHGRRPLLLLGFCGLALNFFLTAAAAALWVLLASRAIGGAMQANASVANAYVADITPPEDRARRFGLLGAMFGIGFILGPVIGGVLGGIDLRLPFWVAGTLALLNLAYGIWVLPESLPSEQRRAVTWSAANPLASLRKLAQLRGVGLLVGVLVCAGLAQFALYTTWVLYTGLRFGWGPAQNGWSLFAVGLVSALVQGVLLGRLLKWFTRERLVLWGLASSTLAFVLWGLATEGWMMFAVIAANLLGNTVAATVTSLVSGAAGAAEQGRTMGAVGALNSLMAVLGPPFVGPLLGLVSHLPPADWRVGTPMFACAVLQAMALGLAWRHFRGRRPAAPVLTAPSPR